MHSLPIVLMFEPNNEVIRQHQPILLECLQIIRKLECLATLCVPIILFTFPEELAERNAAMSSDDSDEEDEDEDTEGEESESESENGSAESDTSENENADEGAGAVAAESSKYADSLCGDNPQDL